MTTKKKNGKAKAATRGGRPRLKAVQIAAAVKQVKAGKTLEVVAAKLGVCSTAIGYHCRKAGVRPAMRRWTAAAVK